MARVGREHFGDRELTLVYVARRLKEALRVEGLFAATDLAYVVETDTFVSGLLFRRSHVGAFFYVAPEDDDAARAALTAEGLAPFSGS